MRARLAANMQCQAIDSLHAAACRAGDGRVAQVVRGPGSAAQFGLADGVGGNVFESLGRLANQVVHLPRGHAVLDALAANVAGYDAAILAISFDTALLGARQIVPVPVLGMTEASLLTACLLGRRFGLISFGQSSAGMYRDLVQRAGLTRDGNLTAFLIGGPRPGAFALRRTADYDVSDAALLPSGDLLVLERKFSLLSGIGIRIRRIPLKSVAPGAVVDGPSIFEADLGQEIDNMEGIDAHVTEDGDTVLTMVSDDNFSLLQRTLLLQFTLVE